MIIKLLNSYRSISCIVIKWTQLCSLASSWTFFPRKLGKKSFVHFITMHDMLRYSFNNLILLAQGSYFGYRSLKRTIQNLLLKKIRLFCAAPPEFITGPILTILGLKWPLKNGPVSCQEKIEVFKMLHGKKCSSFSDDVILRARQI